MTKLIKSLLIASSALLFVLPEVAIAKVPADKLEEVKKREKARGGKVMSPRVGKKVIKAFDLFNVDKDEEGNPVDNTLPAIELLLEINAKNAFDRATVDRFIGGMYAGVEGKAEEAIKYLKKAEEADVLAFRDHSEVLQNLGALSMQEKRYEESIAYNKKYLEFSLDQNPKIYLSIANAYNLQKQFDKVLAPARDSIKYFAKYDKPNQNPYILVMVSFYERKMYKEATKALEDLVKVFPTEKRWWIRLGAFYALIEDNDRALSTYEVAYRNGYLEKEVDIKRLAQFYATAGIPYKSATLQEKHMKEGLLTKNDKSLSIMAQTFQNAKEFKKAAQYFGEAAEMGKNVDYYRKQAIALMAIENFKDAKKVLETALKQKPEKKGPFLLALGEAEFYLENWKASHQAFKDAQEIKSSARTAKGWISFVVETARRKNVTL